MVKINWCKRKRAGFTLVSPNKNLQKAYLYKASDALETSRIVPSIEWKIASSYYCMYFSLYSLLMRIGVKSEIHSCTIEFAKQFLNQIFDEMEISLLEKAFNLRNDSQYYVDRKLLEEEVEAVLRAAPLMYIKCKQLHITETEVEGIRTEFEST